MNTFERVVFFICCFSNSGEGCFRKKCATQTFCNKEKGRGNGDGTGENRLEELTIGRIDNIIGDINYPDGNGRYIGSIGSHIGSLNYVDNNGGIHPVYDVMFPRGRRHLGGRHCYDGVIKREDGWTGTCSDGCNKCDCRNGRLYRTFMSCPTKCSDHRSMWECKHARDCEWIASWGWTGGSGRCENRKHNGKEEKRTYTFECNGGIMGGHKCINGRCQIKCFDGRKHEIICPNSGYIASKQYANGRARVQCSGKSNGFHINGDGFDGNVFGNVFGNGFGSGTGF